MKHPDMVTFGSRTLALAAIFVFAVIASARPDDGRKKSFADSFDVAGAAMWQPFPFAAKVDGGVATIAPPEGQQWLAVEALPGWHWVECLRDVEPSARPAGEGRQRLSLNLPANGREVDLNDGRAVLDATRLFGRRGKLILKLLHGFYLVDEVIVAL